MSECILGGRVGKNGYARLPSGNLYAHRAAWEDAHGPIPPGMHLHHVCKNKACVNVEHLRVLTPQEHFALNRRFTEEELLAHARERERQRYRTDPEFRAKKIQRAVVYKRRKREGATV